MLLNAHDKLADLLIATDYRLLTKSEKRITRLIESVTVINDPMVDKESPRHDAKNSMINVEHLIIVKEYPIFNQKYPMIDTERLTSNVKDPIVKKKCPRPRHYNISN